MDLLILHPHLRYQEPNDVVSQGFLLLACMNKLIHSLNNPLKSQSPAQIHPIDAARASVIDPNVANATSEHQPSLEPACRSDRVVFPNSTAALSLAGASEANLKLISRLSGAGVTLRGLELWIEGTPAQHQMIRQWIDQLQPYWLAGSPISKDEAERVYRSLLQAAATDRQPFQPQILTRNRKGQPIGPKTSRQQLYTRMIGTHDLCFGVGPAGTGKTYLAAVMAVLALQAREFDRLILTRPAVEAGEKLGFLPGDLQEKVDPYLRPLYDALYEFIDPEKLPDLIKRGVIEIAPLAYMRGRTLSNAFIIIDEAQNTTPEQMKMILTRLGFKSRMVVTGDLTQTDLGQRRPSGLATAEKILSGVEGIGFCYFDQSDVVRHPLVQRIVNAYAQFETQ